MASPPSKKIKLENGPEQPTNLIKPEIALEQQMPIPSESREIITITALGLQLDTQIFCFNKEFHLSSVLLKIHTPRIGALLIDLPAARKTRSGASALPETIFKYRLVSYQDAAGWNFRSHSGPAYASGGIIGQIGDAFHSRPNVEHTVQNLLSAVHNKQLNLRTIDEVILLTNFAKSFGGLPIISNALNGVFFNNPTLGNHIFACPETVLEAAYALRHKALFHDSLIFLLGPWSNPRYTKLTNPKLRETAQAAHQKLRDRVAKFHTEVSNALVQHNGNGFANIGEQLSRLCKHQGAVMGLDGNAIIPSFARSCCTIVNIAGKTIPRMKDCFQDMVRNDLILDKRDIMAGKGAFQDYFLSIEIDKYPWDDAEWA